MNSTDHLVSRLRKAERKGHLRAYALIAPLFIFVALSFLLPLGSVLLNSFYDPIIPEGLPRTVAALDQWNGSRTLVPPEPVFEALAQDLKLAMDNEKASPMATRLNFEETGSRTIFMRAARKVGAQETGPWKPFFEQVDPAWAQPAIWGTIRNLHSSTHTLFFLQAVDMKRQTNGEVAQQPEDQRIYVNIFLRTVGVALSVTLACRLLTSAAQSDPRAAGSRSPSGRGQRRRLQSKRVAG